MSFKCFSTAVHKRYNELAKSELYTTDVPDLYTQYLSFFPEGTNPMFRTKREFECRCCCRFIERLGTLVGIKDGKIVTVWDDYADLPHPFNIIGEKLGEAVRSSSIVSVFRTKERTYGAEHNYDPLTNARYNHFYGTVTDKHFAVAPDTKRGEKDAAYQVLKRGLTELRLSDFDDVLELIEANALYKGEDFKPAIVGFRKLLKAYDGTDLYVWSNIDSKSALFRNTAIGNLFVSLASGTPLDDAVRAYESTVAPANYKRPAAIITQKQVEAAVQTLTDLGLGGAIYRRFAKLSDVSVNDVLFVDNESRSKMRDGITELLSSAVKAPAVPSRRDVTGITADDFVASVLPNAKSLALHLQNRHTGNFLSLTGADGPERLFKWDNNFGWSYDGNTTDSVKQRVKAAGGNVNAKLRVSLSWYNTDDLDLHAETPGGGHIYFGSKQGILDVDMNVAGESRNAVENLAFTQLRDGVYKIIVHQFRRRETSDVGFAIEVEFNGVIHSFSYARAAVGEIHCFDLQVKGGQLVALNPQEGLVEGSSSAEKWGVKTETLVPVAAVMYSPNHWGANRVGAKHLIFALKDCVNPEPTRGVYNEFLRPDLESHRRVFEVLGNKTKCPFTPDQVSGVGFTKARGDTVTVVVDGKRTYDVQF